MSAKRKNIIFLSVMAVVLLAFAVLLQVMYCNYKYTDIPECINYAESNAKYEIENVEVECVEIREFEEISSEGILKAKWIYRFKNEDDVIGYFRESETELDYEIHKLYVFQRIICQYAFSENSNGYVHDSINTECLSKDEFIARTREDVREEIKEIAHNKVEHTRDTYILTFIIVILVFFVVLVLWLLRNSDYDEETTEDEQGDDE